MSQAAVPENPAGEVRAEDELDVAAVAEWLLAHAADPAGLDGVPEVRQFAGGASNLTYLLRYPRRELILRRPPSGAKARGAHDMGREYAVQSRLAPVFGYVPAMVAHCADPSVVGAEFYVMEKVEGTVLRGDLPAGLRLDAAGARALCGRFLDVLVELHGVDVEAAGLGDLGKGAGYVGRQVSGWSERFRRARTDNVGDYEPVMAWLAERQPDDVATCVIHNDYRLDNVVLDVSDATGSGGHAGPPRIRAVLDWEMATLGDPLMDLGGALAYWIEAGDDEAFRRLKRQPSDLPGMLTRWEMVQAYTARTGLEVTREQWLFYEVFGLFRLAVIAQQIYYRYHLGQTTNEAYAGFLPMVHYLEQRCLRLIEEAGP